MNTLLLTGFEPFGDQSVNPSWEAVAALPEQIGSWRVEKLHLPVTYGQAAQLCIARAAELRPQAVIAVGQAGGRDALTPEVIAINLREAAIPDNAGFHPQGEPVIPGGEDGLFSTLPVREMVAASNAQGVPAKLSYSAGAYVCNDLFYHLVHHFRGTATRAGFLHVPFLPEQAKEGQPSLTLEDICKGMAAMIAALG
ncbi:MAG: pyroglutamyl-peptidase I [Acutalibacter sp.]|jgi:pyroglutamyl-peptidase